MRLYSITAFTVTFLAIAGWTAFWWVLADRAESGIDTLLAAGARAGLSVECADRRIGGYPFRLDVTCAASSAEDESRGWSGRIEGLRTAALLYRPGHVIAEVIAPVVIEPAAGAPPVTLDWTLGRASVNLRRTGMERVSVAVDGFRARAGAGEIVASHAEAHARPAPDGVEALDVGLAIDDARLGGNAATFDLTFSARPLIPPTALAVGAFDIEAEGLAVSGIDLRLSSGAVAARVEGALSVAPDGLLGGALDVRLAGADDAPALLAELPREFAGPAGALIGTVLALGTADRLDDRPARRVRLTFENGAARMGPITLGEVPPLF